MEGQTKEVTQSDTTNKIPMQGLKLVNLVQSKASGDWEIIVFWNA
jgi:hypothetical protein